MSGRLRVMAQNGQHLVIGVADGSGDAVGLFEDAGLVTAVGRASVDCYPGTVNGRDFWLPAGSYTLTVSQDGAVVHQGPVTVADGAETLAGPWTAAANAAEPAPEILDGGTP